jgi:protoporphyrinogen oxidase
MAMRVGVLGGGALGLTVAYRLSQRGHQVVVLERDGAIGGLAGSFEIGGNHLEKFYHHIFQTDRVIVSLVDELGLGDKLTWRQPRTANLIGGRVFPLDSVPAVLGFTPLPLFDRLRLGAAIALLKVIRDHRSLESYTAVDWTRRWMGRRAYEVVMEPLLRAKFGENYAKIAMPWLWSRFHERTMSLGYLREGFGQLYARLAERAAELGCEIRVGQEVTRVAESAGGQVLVASRPRGASTEAIEERFDAVVATVPTRLFLKLAEGLPDDYRARYDWGEHYGAHCVVLGLDRQLMTDNTYWLSVTEPGYPFLAAVEHTNYMPVSDYAGEHVVYLGNYLPMTHPLYARSDAEVLAEFLPHLRRINPAFDESWVREAHVFKAPFAQPIVTLDYHEHIPPLATPIPNLFLANMFQVYPQDRGQNYSIKLANEVADLVDSGHPA